MLTTQLSWPAEECLLDVSRRRQFTDGRVRCVRLAICNEQGQSARRFIRGETAHLFYEFDVLEDLGAPAGGAEIVTIDGVVVHGKATYQYRPENLAPVPRGTRLRFHQTFQLLLAPGRYRVNVGLASADSNACRQYLAGDIGYAEFVRFVADHCRLTEAAEFEVVAGPFGWLTHHGLVDLPGNLTLDAVPAPSTGRPQTVVEHPSAPTVFHVTHWKAGSQWIYQILRECFPDRIVEPRVGEVQVRHYAIQKGHVYPTVYLSKPEFDALALPEGSKWFVVIRDLRDTLVSAYFSFKISHPVLGSEFAALRQKLWDLEQEDGFIYLMDHFLPDCARIQLSWLEAGEPLIRYEDLLERDVELLSQVLIEHCGLDLVPQRLEQVILANRFEAQTGGRRRGAEDVTAHQRKGVAGDWRNHFTERIKRAFKARYGGLLVATGYENDLNW
ncbi:MAG: Wzt carbohydrate-binding domain-containing protein [Bryobacteraceae bacterium]